MVLLALLALTASCAGGKRGGSGLDGGDRCDSDDDCNDSIDCTVDTCGVGGACRFMPVDELCGDGETCSASRGCTTTADCSSDEDCADSIDCTVDSCGVDMTCRHMALSELCEGGETCDASMGCVAGSGCASDGDCDDSIDCTLDSCGVDMTCRHMALDARCADGEACSETLGCYTPMPCDTADDCQDESFCNGAELCMPEFGCAPAATPRACDDSDDCTIDMCDTTADMCVFACDTSRSECGCPTTGPTCVGTFSLSPGPTYSCGLGAVSYNFSTVTFTIDAGIMTATPMSSSFPPLSDAMGSVCPEFDASVTVSGGCEERYRLYGTFTDDDTFTGTLEVTFVETDGYSCSLGSCTNRTQAVTGTRI